MMCASRVVSDRTSTNERGEVLLRLLAPGSQMAALIGPKGSTIRQARQDLDLPGRAGHRSAW